MQRFESCRPKQSVSNASNMKVAQKSRRPAAGISVPSKKPGSFAIVQLGLLGNCPSRSPSSRLGGLPAALFALDWRTWHCAVRTEDAAIARQWLEPLSAALADIKEAAGVGRHLLRRLVPALRAGQHGFDLHQGDSLLGWRYAVREHCRGRCGSSSGSGKLAMVGTGMNLDGHVR